MDSHNNTGYTSLKIFCESRMASVSLSATRKIWTLNKPIVIPTGHDVQMLCCVESASIPLSFYTINESNCNIQISVQSLNHGDKWEESVRFSIPHGNYNITSLVAVLNDFFDTQKKVCSITYKTNQNKLNFKFMRKRFGGNGMFNDYFFFPTFDETSNNVYKILGLDTGQICDESNHTTIYENYNAPSCVSIIYTSGIYISLNNCQNANIDTGVSNQTSNILIRVPIQQAQNTVLGFFNPVGFKNLLSTNVLSSVDISLLDDNRQLLQLTDNVDWTVVLRIDFQRVIVETVAPTKINQMRLL